MPGNYPLSSCSDPTFIFRSFDRLAFCYQTYGGTQTNDFTTTVRNCVNDYCQDTYPELGGCGDWKSPYDFNFTVEDRLDQGFNGYSFFENSALCANVKEDINSDIAGPGVWISYVMQLAMIVYLWLGLRTFRLIPSITSLYRRARKRLFKRSYSTSTPGGKIRSFFLQHDVVVQATLVEFQEAQCFFMLACQAAILGAKKFNGLFESTTLRSLWANNGAAGLVSSAGILPVVLGMWSLQKRRMLNPWIFFLSVGTVIVSECALYWTRKPPKPDQLVPIEYGNWPTTCGGHTPPLIWCDNTSFFVYERVPLLFFWYYLNPFCLTAFGLIVIMWFGPYVGKVKFIKQNVIARLRPSQQFLGSKWWKWISRSPGLLTFLVEIIFTLVLIIDAACFDLFNDLRVIDWAEWSFGQIVAITLWLPVISKYIYWMIFGTEAYSESRIPRPYKIVKEECKGKQEAEVEFTVLPTSSDTAYKPMG